MSVRLLLATLALAFVPLASTAAQERMMDVDTRALQWGDIEVPGFAPGLKIVVLAGDPGQANQSYTLRLRFPDGYAFPAHWHPMAENVTVLTGTLYLAMGDNARAGNLKRYISGDFLYLPAKMSHYGKVAGETTLQLHGMGPFTINLTQPAASPGQ